MSSYDVSHLSCLDSERPVDVPREVERLGGREEPERDLEVITTEEVEVVTVRGLLLLNSKLTDPLFSHSLVSTSSEGEWWVKDTVGRLWLDRERLVNDLTETSKVSLSGPTIPLPICLGHVRSLPLSSRDFSQERNLRDFRKHCYINSPSGAVGQFKIHTKTEWAPPPTPSSLPS